MGHGDTDDSFHRALVVNDIGRGPDPVTHRTSMGTTLPHDATTRGVAPMVHLLMRQFKKAQPVEAK